MPKKLDLEHDDSNLGTRVERLLSQHDQKVVSSWRIFKIMSEFVAGFEFLSKIDKSVTFFGSARCDFSDKTYREATQLAEMLAREGYAIVTGGGPGIMEAANKGAHAVEGESIGLNIELPHEQRTNQYVKRSQSFAYFFTRKVMLSFSSEAYIYFPGGFGTMDEFFELVTLIQTDKLEPVPVVLVGKDFWQPMIDFIEKKIYEENRAIDKEDMRIFFLADTAEEAFAYLQHHLASR
ncbi:MAG: TIGR00730 family Rossman fold protein [Patescibacteria group bacterium]